MSAFLADFSVIYVNGTSTAVIFDMLFDISYFKIMSADYSPMLAI